jgi:hypothetical protein
MNLSAITGLQDKIANDVWPDGAVLVCQVCGMKKRVTAADCGQYLAHGWPKHCGKTMSVRERRKAGGEARP